MDLLEYQGKQLFARFGIPVSDGRVAITVDEAVAAADDIGYPVVVKAQVLIGGRGKAGGVKLATDSAQVRTHATNILGLDIRGHVVETLWIERASDIAEEYYASFTLDRAAKKHLGMLSAEGGIEIETVAQENPDAIARIHIDPVDGLSEAQARAWVKAAKLNPAAEDGAVDILGKLYTAYVESDADLVEINPLILRADGLVHALDAKVTLDENAGFRHPDWDEYEATQALDFRERLAKDKGLNYVGLDGTVGIFGNGAGLVMSSLDIINQVGGTPANFLDVGGGASADVLTAAVEVLNADPKVEVLFLNIFGGITRGDEVATGVVEAMNRLELRAPIVVRLDGTNAEAGRAILAANPNPMLITEPTMLDAAKKAVEIANAT